MRISDPIERIIANGLGVAGIPYIHESDDPEVCRGCSFYLTQSGIYLNTQPYPEHHTARNLERVENCILIQGRRAAEAFVSFIRASDPVRSPTFHPPG